MYSSLIGSDNEFCTFEAESVHLRPKFGLKCTEFHTFEAEIIYFVM